MKFVGFAIVVFLKILSCAECRMLPISIVTLRPNLYNPASIRDSSETLESREHSHEKVIGLGTSDDERDPEDEYPDYIGRNQGPQKNKKPCAVVVLSNMQNPNMQSLLRKYRYDSNGVLIPSSVQYFIKLPGGMPTSPLLVPLNDGAFSPSGGFVRYYKEVPPIPHSW